MADITTIQGATAGYEQQKTQAAEENRRMEARKNKETAEETQKTESDRVEISEQSKALQAARKAAEEAQVEASDGERAERVEQLKKEIEEGRYEVRPEQVAQKMISDMTGA